MSEDTATVDAERAARVQGFVDAVESDCIYGWAWDPGEPGAKIELQIWLDDTCLGTVFADRARSDLEKLAIGDGACAFEFALQPPLTPQQRARILVLTRPSGEAEEAVALPRLSTEAQRVAALEHTQRRLLATVERIAARQRELLDAQTSSTATLTERVDALREAWQAATDAHDDTIEIQQELRERLATLEVIQTRVDTALVKASTPPDPSGSRDTRSGWWLTAIAVAAGAGGVLGYLLAGL